MNHPIPSFAHWLTVRLVQATAWRFKPSIVSVAGTVGKTTTKAAIAAVLSPMRRVRVAPDGVPSYAALALTLLASDAQLLEAPARYEGVVPAAGPLSWFWVRVLGTALWRLVRARRSDVADVCIAEYGRADEVRTLLNLLRPTIAVLTPIGDVVAAGTQGGEDPLRDFARTVEQLPASAFAVIPADDVAVQVRQRTRAHVLTYGTGPAAHVQVTQTIQSVDSEGMPHLSASVSYGGTVFTLELPGIVGTHHAHTIAAATCVGIIFGATLQDIARAFTHYTPPSGSLRLVRGIKDSMLIVDTYDAHLLSTMSDFDLLNAYPGKRKIVVLGDLLDLGSRSMDVHERIGTTVASFADIFIAVGTRAHIAADAALKAKMNKKKVCAFARAEEAGAALQELVKKGDVILLTGSRVMRLDAVVEEVRLQETADFARAAQG